MALPALPYSAWVLKRTRDCFEDDDNALLGRRDPLIILIPPAFPLSSACPPPYRLPSVSCDPASLPSSLRIPFRDAERKTSLPGDIGASKKGGGGGGGAGWRGNFFISTQIQYERYNRGHKTKGEGRSRMLARGPFLQPTVLLLLARLARSLGAIHIHERRDGRRKGIMWQARSR